MPSPAAIKQSEITRALKAAVAAGVPVGGFEVDAIHGTIRVYAEGQMPKGTKSRPDPDELLG
jgi:hypothetical protein